jgi:hypothetical protein
MPGSGRGGVDVLTTDPAILDTDGGGAAFAPGGNTGAQQAMTSVAVTKHVFMILLHLGTRAPAVSSAGSSMDSRAA